MHWETNNLRIGVDTDSDNDRSWWHGNGVFACNHDPTGCDGELMIYIELCDEDVPGDCTGDRAVTLPDVAHFIPA